MQYAHVYDTEIVDAFAESVNPLEGQAGVMRRPPIAVMVLLLVGAAGCSSSASSSSSDAGDRPGTGSASSSSSTAAGGRSQTGGSSSSSSSSSSSAGVLYGADSLPSPAADHCRTKDLKATAVSTGQGRASVVITNKGDGSCTVRGFPSLRFAGTAGRMELPVDWAGATADAVKVELAPGDSASAALTFTALDDCDVVTGVDVVPPGESRPLRPAFTTSGGEKATVRICDTGVRVKAFSAS
ncbi:uncharacterized protein DUF4232 [Streptomyces sp. Ag109_O5-1]|uniref:DUF4232 domain-containing protein n=1 Tax=Streptomyces sp. Ag109_O5-1 TaxID=1938851 RepID=UPI000F4F294F|nr:DUF4232 domain-containing protein [Streptomyces sp. Ag109_O5-1]RPE43083.1 uncharacterized protein DUF4232 [Streptomyces sp. Ag109_O5-1]